ncbi:hypothetical protein [Carnobacterium maltaromaticum]|uniref:hypothetical protein n=1 Tax=Carnobacterium maltaromaticum TaxID=2751 RepID=UPI0012FC36CF|nr:hypothetical protein [Carnobacterium maltaromaticum]
MAYVHVIKTLSYEPDIDTFSSREKAMKKLDFYYKGFQNQENTKIIKSEESFSVITDDDEHIFNAEYVRKVIR